MVNEYIEKMQGTIEKCHIQLVSYESEEAMRLYTLQNNRIILASGMVVGTKLLIWMPKNTLQSPLEQAWDVAHEIGHAILGHHLANEDDHVKREHDAWNKAECILLANNIPLCAQDGTWTFSESFFVERDWAIASYIKLQRENLRGTWKPHLI